MTLIVTPKSQEILDGRGILFYPITKRFVFFAILQISQVHYVQLETFTPPRDGHNTTGQFDPSVHGFSGPLLTTLPGFPVDTDPRVFNTTQVDSEQFPFNVDMNDGNTIGIGS